MPEALFVFVGRYHVVFRLELQHVVHDTCNPVRCGYDGLGRSHSRLDAAIETTLRAAGTNRPDSLRESGLLFLWVREDLLFLGVLGALLALQPLANLRAQGLGL